MKRHRISRNRHVDRAEPGRVGGMIGPRPIRRPGVIGATVAVVGLLGVASVALSSRPSATAADVVAATTSGRMTAGLSPRPVITPPQCGGPAPSSASAPAARCSSIHYLSMPTSPLPPSPCRDLIVSAARVLGGDPTSWLVSLIDSGGQVGQTIDQAIHDRLEMVRTIVMRTASDDPLRTVDLASLTDLIVDAANQPCSSASCSSDEAAAVDPDAPGTRAGWYWLCESPSGVDTD